MRRQEKIGTKLRDLAYPVSRLRAVHERAKFHLNKIKQPNYLYSPRKGYGQRDNASLHLDQDQYLSLDLKQFYPSTSAAMVRGWLENELGLFEDVAGLLTHAFTIDDRVSFGSPLTPVLCTLIHRRMFNEIADICTKRGLRYSVWVDDLTISGKFIPGLVLSEIREIVRKYGLRSHRISYRTGSKPVFVTGIGVVGRKLIAPNSLNLRIKREWEEYNLAETDDERLAITQRLLSQLGTIRHIVGKKSVAGQRVSAQMNSLRQKRDRINEVVRLSLPDRGWTLSVEEAAKHDIAF